MKCHLKPYLISEKKHSSPDFFASKRWCFCAHFYVCHVWRRRWLWQKSIQCVSFSFVHTNRTTRVCFCMPQRIDNNKTIQFNDWQKRNKIPKMLIIRLRFNFSLWLLFFFSFIVFVSPQMQTHTHLNNRSSNSFECARL